MKIKKTLKIKFFIATFAMALNAFSQGPVVPYWKLNGNPNLPGPNDGVNITNNFLGTATNNNTPIRFGVNGSQDIFIDNNPFQLLPASGNNPNVLQGGHWVGLGRAFGASVGPGNNPLLSPKAHLHIHGEIGFFKERVIMTTYNLLITQMV